MEKKRLTIIPAVYLVLTKNRKILLARRHNTGFRDGDYSLPAGHVEENETLKRAMIREAKEEIGIQIKTKDLTLIHILHRKDENRIDFFFKTKKWKNTPKIMEPNKCNGLNWFNINNTPKTTIPQVKQAIKKITKKEPYSEYGW